MSTFRKTESNEKLLDKLRKVLALTVNPNEHEAALAMERLQELLTKHNLELADLEQQGKIAAAKVKEAGGPDHGKAAFKWKFEMADMLAAHFFCLSLSDYKARQIRFVGRPENIESLNLLYVWLVEQVRSIATVERRRHLETTGEHIDPLRWQLHFGSGAVVRLGERLREQRMNLDATTTALVVHHDSEISDYLEAQYGYRKDGKQTARDREWQERWEKAHKAREDFKAVCEAAGDMEPYYVAYPHERPVQLTPQEQAKRAREQQKRWKKLDEKWEREEARADARARRQANDPEYQRKLRQQGDSRVAGMKAADKINLQPFLGGGSKVKGEVEG